VKFICEIHIYLRVCILNPVQKVSAEHLIVRIFDAEKYGLSVCEVK
jgi:hypothetical protein